MYRLASLTVALLLTGSATAFAQLETTFDAGAALTGGQGLGLGAGAQVALELRPAALRVGLRLDGSHHQWSDGFLTGKGDFRASAVTANLVYHLPTTFVRPYVLGGIGGYALQGGGGVKTGWNAGGGVEVPMGRSRLFGEVRAHFVRSAPDVRLTPLIIGLRF